MKQHATTFVIVALAVLAANYVDRKWITKR